MVIAPAERPRRDLEPLLRPRSIAIVGANNDVGSYNGWALQNLLRTGYAGRVYPVNPRRDAVQGVACYPSLEALPDVVDTAIVAVPAPHVEGVVASCARLGIRSATVVSSGFADAGPEGMARQARLREIARGMVVLGPNTLGVANVRDGVVALSSPHLLPDLRPGGLAIVSQSGGSGTVLLNRSQLAGAGCAYLVTTGNEMDLEVGDVLDWCAEDPTVAVVGCFLETIRDGEAFVRSVRRLTESGKPLVLLQVARSAAGQRAAASHSGALATPRQSVEALCRAFGIAHVTDYDSFAGAAALLLRWGRPASPALAAYTLGGGEAALCADACASAGIALADLGLSTRDRLADVLPGVTPVNPLDPTGLIMSDPNAYAGAMLAVASEPAAGAVLASVPNLDARAAARYLEPVIAVSQVCGKPVVPLVGDVPPLSDPGHERLRAANLPFFTRHAVAAASLAGYLATARRPEGGDRTACPVADERREEARALLADAAVSLAPSGVVPCGRALAVLSLYGVASPAYRVVSDPADACAAAVAVGLPVAVKLDVVHKTDVEGVRLGISSPEGAIQAARELSATSPGTALVVQRMAPAGREVLVGGLARGTFGPEVLVGPGGVLAELVAETAADFAPVSAPAARDLLRRGRLGRLLAGFRGVAVADVDALADALVRISWLVSDCADLLLELDVNPLVATAEHGVQAVDAALLLAPAASTPAGATSATSAAARGHS